MKTRTPGILRGPLFADVVIVAVGAAANTWLRDSHRAKIEQYKARSREEIRRTRLTDARHRAGQHGQRLAIVAD